jgi:hypothetical protein
MKRNIVMGGDKRAFLCHSLLAAPLNKSASISGQIIRSNNPYATYAERQLVLQLFRSKVSLAKGYEKPLHLFDPILYLKKNLTFIRSTFNSG